MGLYPLDFCLQIRMTLSMMKDLKELHQQIIEQQVIYNLICG